MFINQYKINTMILGDILRIQNKLLSLILICIFLISSSIFLIPGESTENSVMQIIQLTDDDINYQDVSFIPNGDRILYVSNESSDGYTHVWQMDISGQNRKQLTFEPFNHSYPSIDDNENMLLYHRGSFDTGREICIQYLSNNTIRKIANGSFPSYNYDYSKIIFLSMQKIDNYSLKEVVEIYHLDSGISNLIPINPSELYFIYTPCFDSKDKCFAFPGHNEYSGIIASPGIHIYFLTNDSIFQIIPEAKGYFENPFIGAYDLDFCFNDRYITYLNCSRRSNRDATGIICIVDLNGTNPVTLFDSEAIMEYDFYEESQSLVYILNRDIYLTSILDIDQDGIPDVIDIDRDGDGFINENEDFPDDPEKWEETEENTNWIFIMILMLWMIVTILIIIIILSKKKGKDGP